MSGIGWIGVYKHTRQVFPGPKRIRVECSRLGRFLPGINSRVGKSSGLGFKRRIGDVERASPRFVRREQEDQNETAKHQLTNETGAVRNDFIHAVSKTVY